MQPSYRNLKVHFTEEDTDYKNNNVEGILVALRYLSLEAEGAGLSELADVLEDTALKWGQFIVKDNKDCERA